MQKQGTRDNGIKMTIVPYDAWIAKYVSENTPEGMQYRFLINGDKTYRTPLEYLADEDLKAIVSPASRTRYMRLYLGNTIIAVEPGFYETSTEWRTLFDYYRSEQKLNPIRFFSPSGLSALHFLNDTESDMKILRAPNRCGKTATAMVDMVLDLVPCDPDWEIFKEHGVEFREWKGPVEAGAASYTSRSLRKSVWTELLKWVPNDQLGDYKMDDNGKAKRSWNSQDPHIKLDCGSTLMCHTYNQSGEGSVGAVYKRFLFDEQPPEFFFDEIVERLSTVLGRGTISATPHKVEGRPDTGAGQLMQALETGTQTKGLEVAPFVMQVGDVPDWVYPDKAKAKKYEKWIIEPQMTGNVKALREGRSRYLGEYHETGGLVYDEWNKNIHVIPEGSIKITGDMTRYRAIDHGVNNPTACIWAAVNHQFDIFIYDEYYERDRTIYENVSNIIERSGNKVDDFQSYHDAGSGVTLERYEESESVTKFAKTVMDGRSFSKQLDNIRQTIGWMYKSAGLVRLRPAPGTQHKNTIPIVKEYLRIDPNRMHALTNEPGAPRIYVMDNCRNFIREISSYVWKTMPGRVDNHNPGEKPREKDDHLMDALKYLCQIPPRYQGSVLPGDRRRGGRSAREPSSRKKVKDGTTGY